MARAFGGHRPEAADVVYVVQSAVELEWLVRAGLATGPFDPFAISVRAGAARKQHLGFCALQIEMLAQAPVHQRDVVPTTLAVPIQLQIRRLSRLAGYLVTGLRGTYLPSHTDLAIPGGVGMLLGTTWFDLGAEWRYQRMLASNESWNERTLLVILAIRIW